MDSKFPKLSKLVNLIRKKYSKYIPYVTYAYKLKALSYTILSYSSRFLKLLDSRRPCSGDLKLNFKKRFDLEKVFFLTEHFQRLFRIAKSMNVKCDSKQTNFERVSECPVRKDFEYKKLQRKILTNFSSSTVFCRRRQ